MESMQPLQLLNQILGPKASSATGGSANATGESTESFGNMVAGALQNVAGKQKAAETLTIAAANGEDVPIRDVVQAVSEAELTLQTLMTVRDRAVEAYQEIARMPI